MAKMYWPELYPLPCPFLFPALAGQGKLCFLPNCSMFPINTGIEVLDLSAYITLVKFISLSVGPSLAIGTVKAQEQITYLAAAPLLLQGPRTHRGPAPARMGQFSSEPWELPSVQEKGEEIPPGEKTGNVFCLSK